MSDYIPTTADLATNQGRRTVSELEEFAAYASMIKRAKAEERDRIVKAFMESFTELEYFYDGVVKSLVAHVDRPEYCEFVIREIIKGENE